MKVTRPESIDDYIAGFPPEVQSRLQSIRQTIHKTVKGATESISYGIAAFTYGGTYLIYIAAYKNHIGLYPVPTGNKDLEKDFTPYYTSGKGTIRFQHDQPLPIPLVKKILKFRLKQIEEKNRMKTKAKNNRNRLAE